MGVAIRMDVIVRICSDSSLHYGNCRIGYYSGPQLLVWRLYLSRLVIQDEVHRIVLVERGTEQPMYPSDFVIYCTIAHIYKQSHRYRSQSTPSWHSRIVTMIRSINTQPTASERIPEDTPVRSGEAVSVGLDDGVAGGQDYNTETDRQQLR